MLKLSVPALLIVSLLCGRDTVTVKPKAPVKKILVVYYFHGYARCPSCHKIENWTRQAVEGGFKAQLKSGRLAWKVINVEEEGNGKYVGKYRLYTKSVVLSDRKGDNEVRWKNLEKVWQLLSDETAFKGYIANAVADYLAGGGG